MQKGFTLIELVVLIVILGILAAVALPKYTDLETEANKAVAEGTAGALAGAAAMEFAKAKAAGNASFTPTCGAGALQSAPADCTYGTLGSCTSGVADCTVTCGGQSSTAKLACY